MAVPLQRRDEAGQDRLEALAADPVRRLPEDDYTGSTALR
jgi:hypothetical protein